SFCSNYSLNRFVFRCSFLRQRKRIKPILKKINFPVISKEQIFSFVIGFNPFSIGERYIHATITVSIEFEVR
ncbi:hypothetical protein, partial [Leptospira interrogans]|uniref:hypothetical protein n=1 Tax=Leptospira interrogans TaxID=173 RepID=UPI001D13A7D4